MINGYKILNGAKYFSSRIFQKCLVFLPAKRYIKHFSDTTQIYSWEINGISKENIGNITKSDSNLIPTFVNHRV